MGASGAGKTSPLNILAGRISKTDGVLKVNSTIYDYDTFGDFGNYVMQNDVLMETLTVKETLMFAADLSMNKTSRCKETRVNSLLKSMKL